MPIRFRHPALVIALCAGCDREPGIVSAPPVQTSLQEAPTDPSIALIASCLALREDYDDAKEVAWRPLEELNETDLSFRLGSRRSGNPNGGRVRTPIRHDGERIAEIWDPSAARFAVVSSHRGDAFLVHEGDDLTRITMPYVGDARMGVGDAVRQTDAGRLIVRSKGPIVAPVTTIREGVSMPVAPEFTCVLPVTKRLLPDDVTLARSRFSSDELDVIGCVFSESKCLARSGGEHGWWAYDREPFVSRTGPPAPDSARGQ